MGEWRTAKTQILEAVTNPLGHIGLDANLPRTVVLVLTGRLRGHAAVDSQAFKTTVEEQFPQCRIEVWDRESLITLFLKHGPEQLFGSGVDVQGYGQFYQLYGKVLDKAALLGDIDTHFEKRLHAEAAPEVRLAAASIEASLVGDGARRTAQPYLALLSTLAALRATLYEMQSTDDDGARAYVALCQNCVEAVVGQATDLSRAYLAALDGHDTLADVTGRGGKFMAYPVACAQLMDALVLWRRLIVTLHL